MNEIEQLKAENERLKEEFEIESLTDNTTGEITYRSNVALRLANETDHLTAKCVKYRTCLQEIKAIAEDRTKTEDYLLGQEYTELVDKILDLITKAESEG